MSLAGGGPFTVPAMDPNYQYKQVIILLTDGLNTQDRWYTSAISIDNRQKMTCDNIKAARDHAVRDPGQYRQRPHLQRAAILRQQLDQVLSAQFGGPDPADSTQSARP